MLVRNRMSRPAVTVRQDADFQKALALMQEKKLRRLPVVDDDGRLVGIVVRDLLVAAMRYLQSRVEIGDVMTRNVVTVGPRHRPHDVARTMPSARSAGCRWSSRAGSSASSPAASSALRRTAELMAAGERRKAAGAWQAATLRLCAAPSRCSPA
jgi:predicted transcriptional regulator